MCPDYLPRFSETFWTFEEQGLEQLPFFRLAKIHQEQFEDVSLRHRHGCGFYYYGDTEERFVNLRSIWKEKQKLGELIKKKLIFFKMQNSSLVWLTNNYCLKKCVIFIFSKFHTLSYINYCFLHSSIFHYEVPFFHCRQWFSCFNRISLTRGRFRTTATSREKNKWCSPIGVNWTCLNCTLVLV